MLFLLSPAKKLDYDTPIHIEQHTQPLFMDQAAGLITVLKKLSVSELVELMSLSPALAQLNVNRYGAWTTTFTQHNSRQAVLAFNGDVYEGLQAQNLSAARLEWAQEHVMILSGLYGVLRPLDLMQPYRLEMGTRLATPKCKNLYEYWRSTIANYLNERLADQKLSIVVNLASEEYFKAVDQKVLKARIVQCVFQDWENGAWKVISFHAKRARGLMARYAIEHKISRPEGLQKFAVEGYAFDADASSADQLVFRRKV